jgi:uncharacterized protein with HEPN domain
MRNLLVHQYFGIDLDQVWDTVLVDLPKLHKDIHDILNDLEYLSKIKSDLSEVHCTGG